MFGEAEVTTHAPREKRTRGKIHLSRWLQPCAGAGAFTGSGGSAAGRMMS